ncbi:Surface antigen protein [Vulgatibacter incomptus]|uniref:Surface antigen protein n=1 Tax=Vulgatibacter incomptus TaxID=1391653 RepID=A0A0K1P8B1_9BACT|nr:Surface antigen protein [Vulgatibacter incomptus]
MTNSGDDTLSFIDPESFEEIARIPIGRNPAELEGPHHLAASPDGRTLFVGISNTVPVNASGPHGNHGTGTADGYLVSVDALTGRQLDWVRVHRSPGDIRLEPGGRRIWQSHYDLVTIAEVLKQGQGNLSYDQFLAKMDSPLVITDARTMERVAELRICPAGHGISFDGARRRAVVTCGFSDQVALVDLDSFDVRRIFVAPDPGEPPVPRYEPYAVAVDPTGRIWVSATGRGRLGLRVLDPESGKEIPDLRIPTDGIPLFGSFLADGSRYYVVTQKPDRLLAIDPELGSVDSEIDLAPMGCLNAHAAVLSPDEASIWIVCEGDHLVQPGSIERLDRATLEPTGHVAVGLYPDDVIYVPHGEP